MSLQQLDANQKKPWINPRCQNLTVDGVLTVDGKVIEPFAGEQININIADGGGNVGSMAGWFFWHDNPIVGTGKVVQFYASSGTLSGVVASTATLTLTFASTPSHLPNSPLGFAILVDTNTIGMAKLSTGSFTVSFPTPLAGGSHTFESMCANYISAT